MILALGPDSNFALTLPSGRILFIPNTPHAAQFLYQILWDQAHGAPERKGYIGSYPTQAAVDIWLGEAAEKRRQELEERLALAKSDLGLDDFAIEI